MIPSCDEAVEVMLADRQSLEDRFRLLLPSPAAAEALMDKWMFDSTARDAGVAVPETMLLSGPLPKNDRTLVLKPRRRYGRAGALLEPAQLIHGSLELERTREKLIGESDEYILQELISGDDSCVEFYGACWKGGKPVVEFTGAKIRQYPPRSGSTACARLTMSGEVLDLSRRLLEPLSFEGCVDVEFKRGPSGALHAIEINPRPGLWHTLGELTGVSLPVAACAIANGEQPPAATAPRLGKRWVYLERDLRTVLTRWREGDGSPTDFLLGLPAARRFAVLSLSDPMPFLKRLGRLVKRRLRRGAATRAAAGSSSERPEKEPDPR